MMRGKRSTLIENRTKQIFEQTGIVGLPVKIEEIVKKMGINLVPYAFDEDISGVLVISDKEATIGFNQSESRVRRRFTIAHELGHYEFHRDKSAMFIDKDYRAIFRSKNSGNSEDLQVLEQEANTFAACILMPEALLAEILSDMEFDLSSEDEIKRLAKIFDVSATAMSFRIINLGLLSL